LSFGIITQRMSGVIFNELIVYIKLVKLIKKMLGLKFDFLIDFIIVVYPNLNL